MNVPESCRVSNTPGDNQNGFFVFKHPNIEGYIFYCIATVSHGWEHLSVTLQNHKNKKKPKPVDRSPTWLEMCFAKSVFWHEDEFVLQIHPPKKDYVSMHPYCLHLWKPTNQELILPSPNLVGLPGMNIQKFKHK